MQKVSNNSARHFTRPDDYDNAKMDTLCRTPDIVHRNKKTKEKSFFCPFFSINDTAKLVNKNQYEKSECESFF